MTALGFKVEGVPAPQGSKSARSYCGQEAKMCPRCHKRHLVNINMVESSKLVAPWRKAVTLKALRAVGPLWKTMEGAVAVRVTFILKRPKSHYRTGKFAHLLKPTAPETPYDTNGMDTDKLSRAVLDAFTDAGVWCDDRQVTDLHAVKIYADPDSVLVAYHHPGAYISATGG